LLSQIRLELKLAEFREPKIEQKFELEIHLHKSNFNPSSIHAQMWISTHQHENSKD